MKNTTFGFLAGLSALFAAASTFAAERAPLWTVTQDIAQPESAYYDGATQTLFVSNVAGGAGDKDGKGWISQLDLNGKVLKGKWVTGLNAPKGLRSSQGVLWVTDIDQLVSIDIKTAKILKRQTIKGAKFLNDIAIGPKGEIYVSDTMANRIYVARNGKASVFAEGAELEAPNGLLISGARLYVAAWGSEIKPDFSTKKAGYLYWIDLETKKRTPASDLDLGHLDGLEQDTGNGFYVSDWMAGKIFHVTAEGKSELVMSGFKNSADIGFIAEKKMLIVPCMGESTVKAYSF